GGSQPPYVYLEIDPAASRAAPKMTAFASEDADSIAKLSAPPASETTVRLVFPVFPTVYSPAASFHEQNDETFYRTLINGSGLSGGERFQLEKGRSSLVVGTGSGFDALMVWLRTGGTVHATDINPMAVANVRTVAALAGFADKLTTEIRDNVAD